MAQINPKLNLNKTPSIVENNSLVFAKNIRLDVDTSIHKDWSIMPITYCNDAAINNKKNYFDYLVERIYRDLAYSEDKNNPEDYTSKIRNDIKYCDGLLHRSKVSDNVVKINSKGFLTIVGCIPNNNEFYLFTTCGYSTEYFDSNYSNEKPVSGTNTKFDCIFRFDEKKDRFYVCNCNWTWSKGTIYGSLITNLIGDKILNIAESAEDKLIPFKSINLNNSSYNDDESIYTQTPNIPITNLKYNGRFSSVIPNGVYQFFIRYKINDNFYTDWFPASTEIFVGNSNSTITSFGTLSYTNTNRDSDNSIILSVEHLIKDYESNYKGFQIGFILSHDDSIIARGWKHFDFNVRTINFDYKKEDIEELEVIDFLNVTYGLYNVKNVTSFKNKLYISNYTETNFNDSTLQSVADAVNIKIITESGGNTYNDYNIIESNVVGKKVISGLIVNGNNLSFFGENGIFYKLLNHRSNPNAESINDSISKILENTDSNSTSIYSEDYGIGMSYNSNLLSKVQEKVREYYRKLEIDNGNVKIKFSINFDNKDIRKVVIDGNNKNVDEVIPYIYNDKRFLNSECFWINQQGKVSNSITIVLTRKCIVTRECTTYNNQQADDGRPKLPSTPITPEDQYGEPEYSSTEFEYDYDQTITITFKSYPNKYSTDNAINLINNTTLIPYQKYKFYIHFVKSNGEITNGYYCSNAGEITAPYMAKCNSVIYPRFSNIEIPSGYAACFFSICHTENNVATVFNINDNFTNPIKEASCIDVNMMLIPSSKNIHIIQGDIDETYTGNYYYSSDTSNPSYFGADGIITFDEGRFENDKLAYIVNDYAISQSNNIELIKCTPYLNRFNLNISNINNHTYYDDYTQMNLLGYICAVSPLIRDRCMNYYTDSASVYNKIITGNNFHLKELSKYTGVSNEQQIRNFNLLSSDLVYIYSNYNLNYVSISEEPKMNIKTYYNREANDIVGTTQKEENESNTILLRLLASQTLSDVYYLSSMYKSYTRKTYYVYREDNITKFNNTVRSSILYGDEDKVYVIKFAPNDYYNVPTNRGIITNLVAIGDAILVHTEDSMFKFSGSNNLQSSQGEIVTGETQPFDTGVSEIFGSDFGFAGLQNKTDHIITENGYIFFDRDSKVVYIYSGQGQIIKISDSIEKLFHNKEISNIYFANDYYNNRFFMTIFFYDYDYQSNKNVYPVTLSFNTSEEIKSFVSLHDFYFSYAFNTKTKCYFLNGRRNNIYRIDKEIFGIYSDLSLDNDKLYISENTNKNIIAEYKEEDDIEIPFKSFHSIVDVIDNSNYEKVKTLNSITWCSRIIKEKFENINDLDFATLNMADTIDYTIPCNELRIYSDTCLSAVTKYENSANSYEIDNSKSYKMPAFNQGVWYFNYFRNIRNSNNNVSKYNSDQNSLIEGKYFVTRFLFKDEFKLETLTFNTNIKI